MPDVAFVVYAPPGSDTWALTPSTTDDKNVIQKLRWKHGDVIAATFTKRRSGPHHRLLFGLLKFVFESQDRFDNMEALRRWLTIQTTFVIEAYDKKSGQLLRMPRSWEYGEMDEIEFSALHDQIETAALYHFYPNESENWLKDAVNYQAFHDGIMDFSDAEKRKAFLRNKIPANG